MMGCRATPIQRMYKQSRKPLPRCKHDTASNMPTNSNVALHFIGVGGSGMSALALVALSQVSTMCTALAILKSRVSTGLPCLWIRFVEVNATCASRSQGSNIDVRNCVGFRSQRKIAGGYMLCWSLRDECWVEKKFFIRAVVCSRFASCLYCAMILLATELDYRNRRCSSYSVSS